VSIPELELELGEGTLGGRFTTIEGLLTRVKEQVISSITCDANLGRVSRKPHKSLPN